MSENQELDLKQPSGGPRKYAPALIPIKTYYSELELIEVIKRAQKRGFPAIGPKSGEKPSTTGLSDYFRTIESESAKFEQFQDSQAMEINERMDKYNIPTEMLLKVRMRK
jgi:hypothetical protein